MIGVATASDDSISFDCEMTRKADDFSTLIRRRLRPDDNKHSAEHCDLWTPTWAGASPRQRRLLPRHTRTDTNTLRIKPFSPEGYRFRFGSPSSWTVSSVVVMVAAMTSVLVISVSPTLSPSLLSMFMLTLLSSTKSGFILRTNSRNGRYLNHLMQRT